MSGIKTSARNLFKGTVKKVVTGAVNSEVVLDIGGQEIVAIITNESVRKSWPSSPMKAPGTWA